MDPETLFRIVDVAGVIANGLIGATLARSLAFDMFGFLALGIVTALGGGMTRDALLGIGFPVALTDPWYLWGAIGAAVFAYLVPLDGRWARRLLAMADVGALGCWSATGAAKGMMAGLNPVPSIFLGTITAVMGGIYRDVMIGRRPAVFGSNPLYATFSVIAAGLMVVFQSHGMYELGMGLAIAICVVFGLLARRFHWMLPIKAMDLSARLRSEKLKALRVKSMERARRIRRHRGTAANPDADRILRDKDS
ncbi:putative membrane protein YeiH [Arcanobacterium wilhelmae]|uniref:Membrane protein YeiH n=1 Tax=Arcanobacterium wilhelmae TaxID=1803177 RepID=A0ABT9NB73_9ACTO|nr:trimeric intracellular cation channel family protein [Arcanobacterium wilhelmae]MDP9800962.1 putative membrane protein YeiH [Arcanobacterium wilhelmae]WFN90322.1 trimeric intracellular cation channel family protein [Arcanobacterium wilhelmae]